MSQLATFGAGCFWGVQAILKEIPGVQKTLAGYMGGPKSHPTYEDVKTGRSDHAEIVQIEFDPLKISYQALLGYFWRLHDPTQLNRQGVDVGTQYRSVIFYHSEQQRVTALKSKAEFDNSKVFSGPAVTQILPAETFWRAEEYHQDWFDKHPGQVCHYLRPR